MLVAPLNHGIRQQVVVVEHDCGIQLVTFAKARFLNEVTVPDPFPPPRTDETLEALKKKARYMGPHSPALSYSKAQEAY